MKRVVWTTVTLALLNLQAVAQDYGQEYIGTPTPSGSEPLFKYDDLEVWKHGWLQINPYEHGYHSYRPYNYKHVFSQAAQSAAWGMPSTMPYSQSYYLRHGSLTGINGDPLPTDSQMLPLPGHAPTPSYNAPQYGAPMYPVPSYGMPTSMLRQQPFSTPQQPQQYNNIPGLTQLPGHQFPTQQQAQVTGDQSRYQTISPTNFQQFHQHPPAGPEFERQQLQKAQMQQMLYHGQQSLQGPSFR